MSIRLFLAALALLSLIPQSAGAQIIPSAKPKPDIFGGGNISLLYRVLDTHKTVRSSIGIKNETLFLAKGSGSAVYLIRGRVSEKKIVGERLVFSSEAVYRTWFSSFVPVRHFSDDALKNSADRGALLPAPGTLVKHRDDPRVYLATLGRVVRHIENEEVARLFFGDEWARHIIDLPAVQFTQYRVGNPISARTRLTELDVPPLPTDDSAFRIASYELAARLHPDISISLRDIYRQILAKRYLNILVAWDRETGSFPPSITGKHGDTGEINIGTLQKGGSVSALSTHPRLPAAVQYLPEESCADTLCFAFVPEAQNEPCGKGASPFIYNSTGGEKFSLDFCIESPKGIITIPEVAIEIHLRDMPMLAPGWYRFTERGLK